MNFSPRPPDPEKAATREPAPTSATAADRTLSRDKASLFTGDAAAPQLAWEASPGYPRKWKNSKRWKNALIISITGFLSTLGSSIFVPATAIIMEEYGLHSREVAVLTTSLYVMGLGSGPFVFAPISELYGRQAAYTISMIGESPALLYIHSIHLQPPSQALPR